MDHSTPEITPLRETTPARGRPDVSVVIVNYNVREFLEQALRSVIRAGQGLGLEVFVVDNDSIDGSVEMVRAEFPGVKLIVNDENVGFGRANNQAIRRARGRYLLILNPDTIVQEDTLRRLVEFMDEHPEAGAAGCKIFNPDGTFARESRRAFPTPEVAFYRLIGLATLFPRSRRFGRYNMTYLPENEVAEVDALSGSCMMVRRRALREPAPGSAATHGAGIFDENFFMYGEDLDWCYRIQKAGWKIFYTPATQIIHYKGESTKKGELRYVRLFYGAMLRFTQKHFENRYSRVFAAMLRAGIVFRAFISVVGKAARTFAWPIADFLTMYFTTGAIATAHAATLGASPAPLFFAAVAPAYGLGAVAGIGAAGGYGHRRPIRAVWIGMFLGMLVVASVSFFIKDIAFSRAVILASYPAASSVATVLRLLWTRRENRGRSRRAVLVGERAEALRLRQMLARHPGPPFTLHGYVTSGQEELPRNGAPEVTMLGRMSQLRDIVRLGHIDDVVFASAVLSNQTIFRLIQQLRDLPVHFRILAEGRDHVIGKASVDDLSMANLVEADETFVHTRSPFSRRLFDLSLASIGLVIHPFILIAGRLAGPDSFAAYLASRTRRLTDVLRGRCGMVGYDPEGAFRPPTEWQLKPGIFPVTDALEFDVAGDGEISGAYWFYVRNQSASLDWDIMARSLRAGRKLPVDV